jgi:hypothetical protein
VTKAQLSLSIQWMADREVDICKLFNRISHRTRVRAFLVAISELGDGGAWYMLIVTLPLIYGLSGLDTSFDMGKWAL